MAWLSFWVVIVTAAAICGRPLFLGPEALRIEVCEDFRDLGF